MTQYILAHDLGTSADKASLFTTEGKFVKTKTIGYETNHLNGSWVEQNAQDWWDAFCTCTKELVKDIDPKDIKVVAIDGTYPDCILVDKDCNPVYPAIIWQDTRTSKECDDLTALLPEKYCASYPGKRMKSDRVLPKLMWVKNNLPEVYAKADKVLCASHDYLIMKLTGKAVIDPRVLRGTAMRDTEKYEFADEVLELCGISKDILPEYHLATDVVGEVNEETAKLCGLAAGTKIIAGSCDTECNNIGACLLEPGDAYMIGGTSAGVVVKEDPAKGPAGGQTSCSGGAFSWLKNVILLKESDDAKAENRNVFEIYCEKIEKSPIGANGVMFHPYLAGERAPRNNLMAKGSFVGISLTTSREDIIRSVVEGIGFNINVILQGARDKGYAIDSMMIMGGLGKSDTFCQIFADIMNCQLKTVKFMDETATVGCAVLGGIALGIYKDYSAAKMFVEVDKIFDPIKENVEKYNKLKPVYEKIYEGLEPVYPDLYNISL